MMKHLEVYTRYDGTGSIMEGLDVVLTKDKKFYLIPVNESVYIPIELDKMSIEDRELKVKVPWYYFGIMIGKGSSNIKKIRSYTTELYRSHFKDFIGSIRIVLEPVFRVGEDVYRVDVKCKTSKMANLYSSKMRETPGIHFVNTVYGNEPYVSLYSYLKNALLSVSDDVYSEDDIYLYELGRKV